MILLVAVLLGTGCSSDPEPVSEARGDYDAGRYGDAHRSASAKATSATGDDRAEAAYLAGVSAYRMGDYDEAEKQFFVALESDDPVIVGRTNATLGLMRKAQGRPASSAGFFRVAAEKLDGEEGAIAAREAAAAYQQLGRSFDADQMMKIAQSKDPSAAGNPETGSAALRAASAPSNTTATTSTVSSGTGRYAVQLGAFSKRSSAEDVARRVAPMANRLNFGQPRISIRNVNGKELHIVQVGSFTTHAEAEQARTRLGQSDSIVAAVR